MTNVAIPSGRTVRNSYLEFFRLKNILISYRRSASPELGEALAVVSYMHSKTQQKMSVLESRLDSYTVYLYVYVS